MWASTISGISTCPHVLSLFDVLSGRYRPAVHMHERDIPSGFRLNSNHISTGIGIIGSCYSSAYRGINSCTRRYCDIYAVMKLFFL